MAKEVCDYCGFPFPKGWLNQYPLTVGYHKMPDKEFCSKSCCVEYWRLSGEKEYEEGGEQC